MREIATAVAQNAQVDLVALTTKFYRSHNDNYDQLVLWSDAPVITDAFAYETTVKNEIRGIGVDTYDLAADFPIRFVPPEARAIVRPGVPVLTLDGTVSPPNENLSRLLRDIPPSGSTERQEWRKAVLELLAHVAGR